MIFQELSNEYKIAENGVRMQKLSTFEVGEVGWVGVLAQNATKTWTKYCGKSPRKRMRERPRMLVRERGASAWAGIGSTTEMLLKAENFKQA